MAELMLPKKASRTSSSSTSAAALESKRSSASTAVLSPPSACHINVTHHRFDALLLYGLPHGAAPSQNARGAPRTRENTLCEVKALGHSTGHRASGPH